MRFDAYYFDVSCFTLDNYRSRFNFRTMNNVLKYRKKLVEFNFKFSQMEMKCQAYINISKYCVYPYFSFSKIIVFSFYFSYTSNMQLNVTEK